MPRVKKPFPYRIVTGILLAAMLAIPLGAILSSSRKQPAVIAEVGSIQEDSEGDWMVEITLINRSYRQFWVRGNSSDFLLHEIQDGNEVLRYPLELDERQTNHVSLHPQGQLATRVSIPARMSGQAVRIQFHLESEALRIPGNFRERIGVWWDERRWTDSAAKGVVETGPFVPQEAAGGN